MTKKYLLDIINKILYDEEYSKDLLNYIVLIASILFSDVITQEQAQNFILHNQTSKSILINEHLLEIINKIKVKIVMNLKRMIKSANCAILINIKKLLRKKVLIRK